MVECRVLQFEMQDFLLIRLWDLSKEIKKQTGCYFFY